MIFLDGGTTTLQVARSLSQELKATVITNSPPIAVELAEHPFVEVIVIGGKLHKEALVTEGVTAVETIQTVRADVYMMGVFGLHPDVGISVPNLDEAQVKRAMIANAAEVVALISSEKLGTAGPYVVGPLSALTHLVTDRTTSDNTLAPYRAAGITIVHG